LTVQYFERERSRSMRTKLDISVFHANSPRELFFSLNDSDNIAV